MSKKKKSKFSLAVLKYSALQLRKNYQLPFYLTHLITSLKSAENVDYLKALCDLSDELLRVKGYYKRHKEFDDSCKPVIVKYLTEKGFTDFD